MFSYLDMLSSIKLLCSAFVNRETEDCYPKFLLEIEYGERQGSVTDVQHFCTRVHISLGTMSIPTFFTQNGQWPLEGGGFEQWPFSVDEVGFLF